MYLIKMKVIILRREFAVPELGGEGIRRTRKDGTRGSPPYQKGREEMETAVPQGLRGRESAVPERMRNT
jgi:hypothetical protein